MDLNTSLRDDFALYLFEYLGTSDQPVPSLLPPSPLFPLIAALLSSIPSSPPLEQRKQLTTIDMPSVALSWTR